MNDKFKSLNMGRYTRFIIIIPLICVFFVFANDSSKATKSATEPPSQVVEESKKTAPPDVDLGAAAPGAVSKKDIDKEEEKSLVEVVTDALEEEEDETFAYTPAIAPATPLASVFLISPSMSLQTDYETSSSKITETTPKQENIGILEQNGEKKEEKIEAAEGRKLLSVDIDGALPPSSSQNDKQPEIISTETASINSDSSKSEDETPSNVNINDTVTDTKDKNDQVNSSSIDSSNLLNPTTESSSNNNDTVSGLDKNDTDEIQPLLNVDKGSNKEIVEKSASLEIEGSDTPLSKTDSNDEKEKEKEKILPLDKDVKSTQEISPETSLNESVDIMKDKIEEKNLEEPQQPVVVVETPEENEGASESDKKMLSFAEWKKRLDKEKVDEDAIEFSADVQKNKTQKEKKKEKRKHKIRKNFASIDCGGKVVSANKEASNILSVLKDDKDAYMLNPCNVKAWFVVELCDRIQIDSIDIANFEMFSSTPSSFIVYVTSRYPSGSWEKVGTFEAGPEKQIQTYHFDEKFYGRFIKIEIKKYHGKEHYCPLSLLRVFGITEVEQFEEDGESDNSNEESQTDEAEHSEQLDENSGNIFQAAKNVVADIVNGMAKKLSGKSESETNESAIIISKDDSEKSLVVTVSALDKDHSEPNEQNGTLYYKDSFKLGENVIDWDMWYYYRLPKKTCSKKDYKRYIKNITATVYFNNSQSTIKPTVVLKPITKTPLSIEQTSQKAIVSKPVPKSILKSEVTPSEVQKATEMTKKTEATELPTVTPFLSVIPLEKPTIKLPASTIVVSSSESSAVPNTLTEKPKNVTNQPSIKTKLDYNEDSVDVLEFQVNDTKGGVVASKIDFNASSTVSKENKTKPDNLNDNVTAVNSTNENETTATELSIDTPSSLPDQNVSTKTEPAIAIAPSSSSAETASTSIIEAPEISSLSVLPATVTDKSSTIDVVSTPVAKTKQKKAEVNAETSEKETQPSAKTTSGSKESIIAKLNTKVKALQANLTMSMMYLDEMSEQYRTAVANVDTRYKKKTMALNASIQQQQLIIRQQTYLISNLTKQVDILIFQLQNLTLTTQEQHQKIIETHATWVFLEITIILIFLLLCRGKTRSYNDNYDDCESDTNSRRYSEPVMIKKKENLMIERPVRRQLSDPTGLLDQNQPSSSIAKKRKRRKAMKANSLDLSDDLGSSSCNNGDLTASNEKAGLIFGRGLFTGIFSRKKDSIPKISRQADALLDEVTEKMHDSQHQLRKARSSELPTIEEDQNVENSISRPKSCGFLMNDNRKNKNRFG